MALDQEAVYSALYDRLRSQVSGLKFTSRRDLAFSQIAQAQQPAMIVIAQDGTGNRQFAVPTIWTMRAKVIFFARQPTDPTLTVESTLNGLIKKLDAALQRQVGEVSQDDDPGTTLGGLVFRCYRSDYTFHTGDDDDQAAAAMIVEMVAPE
jgi:hypothetical protein